MATPFALSGSLADVFANRPAPSADKAGRFFLATDTGQLYRDTGAAWLPIRDALTDRPRSGPLIVQANDANALQVLAVTEGEPGELVEVFNVDTLTRVVTLLALATASTEVVANLNAEKVGGKRAAEFLLKGESPSLAAGGAAWMANGKEYHLFTASGILFILEQCLAKVFLVGGGGGGGADNGGGGGGGDVKTSEELSAVTGIHNIIVGSGGNGGAGRGSYATKGGASSAFGITAEGGGPGGQYNNQPGGAGASGGGGASHSTGAAGGSATQSGTTGYNGAAGNNSGSGGGGGKGSIGEQSEGGYGIASTFIGIELRYGGGGGGANRADGCGRDGGGNGNSYPGGTTAGANNTGGGGGGGYSLLPGGAGGSGIVIVELYPA